MKKGWLLAALGCVLGFIFFEACGIRKSVRLLGKDCSLRKSWSYSAADIYFSAITPSASGGQPASAFLMLWDGIPGVQVTAALLLNLAMYSCSLVAIGLVCLVTRGRLFLSFGRIGRAMILVGCLVQLVLMSFFLLLIRSEGILWKLGRACIHGLGRLHLLREEEKLLRRFCTDMEQYRACLELYGDRKGEVWQIFLCNLLQRSSQIGVTVCVYLAMGGGKPGAFDLWALQSFVVIGANYIPIPGGMGVTDYLMLDGFSAFFAADQAAELEILSRSLSFYVCVAICGGILLGKLLIPAIARKEKCHDRCL